MGEYSSQIKNHPLHRPLANYFSDKKEMKREAFMEAQIERLSRQDEVKTWVKDLRNLKKVIEIAKNSVHFCLICGRKFASAEALKRHEEESEMHKQRLKLLKSGGGFHDLGRSHKSRKRRREKEGKLRKRDPASRHRSRDYGDREGDDRKGSSSSKMKITFKSSKL